MDVREMSPLRIGTAQKAATTKGHREFGQGQCISRHRVLVEAHRVVAPTAASCATRRGPCSLQDVKHGVAAQVGCLTPQGLERHDPEYVGEGQPGATTEPISPRIMSRGIYRAKIATENVGSVTVVIETSLS